MGYFSWLTTAAAAVVCLSAVAPNAHAEILASASRSGNFSSSTSSTAIPLALDSVGSTSLAFKTTVTNETVRILYNAECGVEGPVGGSWLSVTIVVDGVEAHPASGTSFALCTSASTTNFQWTGAVRQSQVKVAKPGIHKVTVNGIGVASTEWWLGDTSIVVDR